MTPRSTFLAALLLTLPAGTFGQSAADSLPEWRRQGVCYEIFVRSFADSDGDGVGDLPGLTARLDYVNDGDPATPGDLGATCIWLMPIAQSPSYHGYDVSNYYQVNRDYGTNQDFQAFVAAAHQRGIRVIVDLVLNHMSSEHPFFKSALLDAASPWRDWFTWAPAPRPSPGWTAPVWHRVEDRDEYYYGLFWRGMPDINLANAAATRELENVARFWLQDMDVDGFRLDAVGHFFEGPDGQWKNGPGVHPWLRDYAAFLRTVKPGVFTVAEVWDNLDAILPYYPDQLESHFMFEVADSLIAGVGNGRAAGFIATVARVQRSLPPGRWSPFISSHDRNRPISDLGGDVARARLAATLLLTLPGFPFLYYGEELGMSGVKPDPRLRTPMHWTREPAAGFTTALPWEPLQPDSFTANVAVQDADAASLLNHYRKLIRVRAAEPALGADAEFIPLETGNGAVAGYLRRAGDRAVLVVANLGTGPVAAPTILSGAGVLRAGAYRALDIAGSERQATLRIAANGRVTGLPALGALDVHVLELTRR